MKRSIFFIFFLVGTINFGFSQERYGPYKISKFVDGDTFWVKVEVGKTVKIRLIGVDTPEVEWKGLTEERPVRKLPLI